MISAIEIGLLNIQEIIDSEVAFENVHSLYLHTYFDGLRVHESYVVMFEHCVMLKWLFHLFVRINDG